MDATESRYAVAYAEHRSVGDPLVGRAFANARTRWAAGPDPAWVALGALPVDQRQSVAITLIARGLAEIDLAYTVRDILSPVVRGLAFSREDAHIIARLILAEGARSASSWFDWFLVEASGILHRAVVQAIKEDGLGDLDPVLQRVVGLLDDRAKDARTARIRARFAALLDDAEGGGIEPSMFGSGDSWGETMAREAARMDPALGGLVRHLALADSVTPSASWRAIAAGLVAMPGAGHTLAGMLELALTSQSSIPPTPWEYEELSGLTTHPDLEPQNSILVRGAVWAAALLAEPWAPDLIGRLGLRFGTSGRSDNIARDERVANSAAAALGVMGGDAAFAALGRMKARVTNRNVSKQIAKALDGAAGRLGISPSEILELSVPGLGFDDAGERPETEGGWSTVLHLAPGGGLDRTWTSPAGVAVAKPGRDADAAWVKRLKESDKEIRRELAVERGRVEDLLVETRDWPIAVWRDRYLQHPVTRAFGRTLIWRFVDAAGDRPGLPLGDAIVGPDGTPLAIGDDARVRVWHPIEADEAEISAWRTLLLEHRIRQPFKQAFREVYRLTPAEETTGSYSNRFAGHVLLYLQARALMTARRWGSNFLGPYDGGYSGLAKRDFPTWRIRAEFFHDAIEPAVGFAPVRHCSTDQVRFQPTGRAAGAAQEVVALADVPAIVFSEAMRDVDLFVGVSSVAADANWQDQGPARIAPFEDLFTRSFAEELSSSAVIRRDVLARILPGLAIADRCELLDRWLRVRGDVRTYRIHLGSGNILMEPSDAYLCIVPARGNPAERVFLPFDDDPRLALILSKAFLLAADRKIRDQTIIRQIEQR